MTCPRVTRACPILPTPGRLLVVGAALALCACRVAMIGDSITEGVCSSDPCTGWVELVAVALLGAEVVNAGCGATTTASWIQHPPEPAVGVQSVSAVHCGGALRSSTGGHPTTRFHEELLSRRST